MKATLEALDRNDGASRFDDVLPVHIRERLRDRRPRVRLVRGPAKAAADEHIESREVTFIGRVRHQPKIVRVDVDAVVAFNGDGRLELARQVALPVEGVGRVWLVRSGKLTVEPDLERALDRVIAATRQGRA